MVRVTDSDIERRVQIMQEAGMDVALDSAYGRYKVTNRNESRDLSPRAPNREILDWLHAYQEGWNARATKA